MLNKEVEAMKEFTAAELARNFEEIGREAMRQPVTIVDGDCRWTFLSLSEFKALQIGDPRRAYRIEDMPEEHAEALRKGVAEILDRGRHEGG